jgi:hypothetical protein|tara:strand:- start:89 stop:337 length:249 start_codon:yes stop_codon:yes gene_type:complete
MKLKDNTVYNRPDNLVFVRTNGDEIHVICKTENQMDEVVKKLTTDNCKLAGYEEWDEDVDKKYILTFLVCDVGGVVIEPELN